MASIYADMIEAGLFPYENVPTSRKEAVDAELTERGYFSS
ncbi:hypothetical protein SAMN04490247_3117 [Salimicrobium halophilum]|uniref:Uncharacterized protein n=1 Tax=Salimicrobium halophilum TaxID=86666 RepID=A0A1G8WCI1_9BACI|nr:hypothetical protein SAMN04490247_3117 [Salimicrobium halophilum]